VPNQSELPHLSCERREWNALNWTGIHGFSLAGLLYRIAVSAKESTAAECMSGSESIPNRSLTQPYPFCGVRDAAAANVVPGSIADLGPEYTASLAVVRGCCADS
jgi:hypothetical protein